MQQTNISNCCYSIMNKLCIGGIFILMFAMCTYHKRHEALYEIDKMCDKNPKMAISMLDGIDQSSLSDEERHYFDLLSIKAADKAYICHTSDSLILKVVDYYSKHSNEGHYSQALYYGGRVYADLGDYPKAIEYFQKASESIPNDKESLEFKSIVHSQTGRLLLELRLNEEAISEIGKSIDIDNSIPGSCYGNAFNHHLIAIVYLRLGDKIKARQYIDKAIDLSKDLPKGDQADILVDLADLMLMECKFDSALSIIRPLLQVSDSISLPYTKACAAQIYRYALMPDSAYLLAMQLIEDRDLSIKKVGYDIIFSDELRSIVPLDTLQSHIIAYRNVLESQITEKELEYAHLSRSRYNYDIIEKEKNMSKAQLNRITKYLYITILIILILSVIILFRRSKLRDNRLRSLATAEVGRKLRNITHSSFQDENNLKIKQIRPDMQKEEFLACLKKRLDDATDAIVDEHLINSEICQVLRKKIIDKKNITLSEKDIWDNLNKELAIWSPDFYYRLGFLCKNKNTESENKVALLMKYGFSPSNIAILLGRERSTISTQKKTLAVKIFGNKPDMTVFNALIISL